ncbi:MAG: long-chain fatty acid--CoA ligase [Steroidobacteraceae bacterium]
MTALPHVHATVVHMLDATARAHGEREALVCGSERLSYEAYRAAVAGFANELRRLDLAGKRIALVLGNSIDICIAMFAVHAAGAVCVPLNPIYTIHELGPILEDADPAAIVFSESLGATLHPVLDRLAVGARFAIGSAVGSRRLHHAAADESLPEPMPAAADIATLQYTGGTTGRSKGAILTHGAIATNISQRQALVPTGTGGERILCTMPLFHVYAVAMCLHNAVYSAATLVILPRFTADAVFATQESERFTILAGSPTVFTALMADPRFAAGRFEHIRMSYSGSAPLPAALLGKWEDLTGAPVLEGYGLSESGPVLSFNPSQGVRKPLSVGLPVPGTQLQIVDAIEGERVLGIGEIGEIRVRGPQIMRGYRNRPEETAAALRDGWLYTGDLGELDADGYLYIRDRKKDMILVSGYNVYPREVEEVLFGHPDVLEGAVIGVPDDYRGNSVKAFVVVREGQGLDEKALDRWCRERLAAYKVPRIYEFIQALPRTPVGKIDRKQLRA